MRMKFWLIYGVVGGLLLVACYFVTADLSRSPLALSDEEMAAIRGSWWARSNMRCIWVGGCPTEFCRPNTTHNYDQVGNDAYDECRNDSGYTCFEEEPPYSSWYCKYRTYNVNNCDPNYASEWQWNPLPDCTN